MKTIYLIIIFCLFSVAAYAEPEGFQNIAFGTAFDKVKADLINKYGEDALYLPDEDDSHYIWLKRFELGDRQADVTFMFDHNAELYAFKIQLPEHTADHFNTSVIDDGNFISQVFKNKYGKPSDSYNQKFFNVSSGYDSYLCKWKNKNLEIFTSLSTYEFKYYAAGYVSSKKMSKEYKKFLAKEESKAVKKAGSKF